MQRFFGEKRDSYGRVEVGASVSVYETGTSNLATIYSASDTLTTPTSAIPNPMTTDSNGRYGFAANNGTYDIVVKGSGSSEYHNKVNLFDSSTSSTSGAGGSSTQVQYNSGGVLTGSSALTTDGTNLTVGGYSSVEATRFNTSTPDTSNVVGNTYWDSTNGTLATVLDATAGVVLQHGQELHVSCVNKTGVLIPNGSAVYVNDAQGNRPTCALAKADSLSTCQVIGVTTQAIAINGTGLVTIAGDVHDYNTSVFSGDGKTLYLSAATAGLITETAPTSPNYLVTIGTNLNTTSSGTIFVSPSRPIALDTTLAADSGLVAPSQKATKTYADGLYQNILTSLGDTSSPALGDALVGVKSTLTGGAARTQHGKNADVVSVLDFGSVDLTGSVDASAILILANTGAAGQTLVFPSGIYKISSNVTFGSTVGLWFANGAVLSIDTGVTVTANGQVIALYGNPNSGSGTMTYGNQINLFANQYGFGFGSAPPSNSDDFFHVQRDVDTSSGILVINDNLGTSAEGFVHIFGGERSGGNTGSGIRMSANSKAGGSLVDIVGHDNLGFAIIQASSAPLDFYVANLKAFSILNVASAVNYWEFRAGATGSSIQLFAQGTDTDVNMILNTKGAGSVFFKSGTGYQLEIQNTSSATNRVVITGSTGTNGVRIDSSSATAPIKIGGTADIQWGKALVAMGGGSSATLGTIGGSGPATSTQNTWMRVVDASGVAFWVPAWK